MGAIGAWVRGIHLGEARTQPKEPWALGQPPKVRLLMRLLMRLLLGILLELLGILPISPDVLGFYYISNTVGETIGDISQTIGDVVGDTTTIFTDFSDFLGRLLLLPCCCSNDYLFFFQIVSSGGIRQ